LINDNVAFSTGHNMELETIVACSDGYYDPTTQQGSHGCIFANTNQAPIFQGAGPVDCHPPLISSYRSELDGIIAVLHIIYRICMYHEIMPGEVQ
jgi:hypothetical protein